MGGRRGKSRREGRKTSQGELGAASLAKSTDRQKARG